MYSPRKRLDSPTDFSFPYDPYDIQKQLMRDVFSVLEQKQIGIFESPTGTGKSLTLTCAALTWLENHEALVRNELKDRIEQLQHKLMKMEQEIDDTDWINKQSILKTNRHEMDELRGLNKLVEEYEDELLMVKKRRVEQRKQQKNQKKENKVEMPMGDVSEISVPLSMSDDWIDDVSDSELETEEISSSSSLRDDKNDSKTERYRDVKIFFCSRTHSQLTQIFSELRKTKFKDRVRCVALASRQQLCINAQVRRLPNVSLMNERCLDMANSKRKNCSSALGPGACKKPRLAKLEQVQQNQFHKCSYKSQEPLQNLSDVALTELCDIEDLVKVGKELQACPYYAARQAQPNAQLILLPYQMLFHNQTRSQNGIDIRGAVIIIDEAHNLIDSITQIHSCELTLQQLLLAHQQITAYKMRYSMKFKSSNLLKINKLLYVIKRLSNQLKFNGSTDIHIQSQAQPQFQSVTHAYKLMSENDLNNINLYEILQFCSESRFAQKLHGFTLQQNESESMAKAKANINLNPNENQVPNDVDDDDDVGKKTTAVSILKRLEEEHKQSQIKSSSPSRSRKRKLSAKETTSLPTSLEDIQKPLRNIQQQQALSPMRPLLAFLEALTKPGEDGRVIITCHAEASQAKFKYFLLNPNEQFSDIIREARAIIIAGGTMQPTQDLKTQLFRALPPERLREHFYSHVVPSNAVLPFVITTGPKGRRLKFDYTNRGKDEMISELSMVLQNLCHVVPGGLVCFLPSYDFLDTVYKYLKESEVLTNIKKSKDVFRDYSNSSCNGTGQTVEELLQAYSQAIRRRRCTLGTTGGIGGALMLSVVGGKLSEGLNFADDLGRGVIVVGLPYPNCKSPELAERMRYLDKEIGNKAGREYYNNLCMKAVNQCIGRSIRHIRDYACVYLLDERYTDQNIQSMLPSWISRALKVQKSNFGQIQGTTVSFFKQNRIQNTHHNDNASSSSSSPPP